MIQTLRHLFTEELDRLHLEIELYHNEQSLWYVETGISNSGGNLCLHLIGNLNTYIGKELGKTSYVRHRDLEFSLKDVPKDTLLSKIAETKSVVEFSLGRLSEADLLKPYPILWTIEETTTEHLLLHLLAHLGYHVGQINYHRRLVTQNRRST